VHGRLLTDDSLDFDPHADHPDSESRIAGKGRPVFWNGAQQMSAVFYLIAILTAYYGYQTESHSLMIASFGGGLAIAIATTWYRHSATPSPGFVPATDPPKLSTADPAIEEPQPANWGRIPTV
jgi:hypothetical protein